MTLISERAAEFGVRRLCHLTPFRNLLHIATGRGVLSVAQLDADERAVFTKQDLDRYDQHPDHISCSVEYPNVWYLAQKLRALSAAQVFYPDWVCLLIDPVQFDRDGVKFSPFNAASGGGSSLAEGLAAFDAMFADPVTSGRGTYHRGSKLRSCPTDDQAEVMLPRLIPLDACRHVVVRDEEGAARIYGALDIAGGRPDSFTWTIAADFFDRRLSGIVRSGQTPVERLWTPAS